MTCAELVRTHLLTLSPVTALVNTRIWAFRFPQSPTLPAVLAQQISDVREPHLRGVGDLKVARIQIDVIARTMAAARDVDAAILGDFTGGAPTGLQGAVVQVGGSPSQQLGPSFVAGYREVYDGDELKQARVIRDYRVWYEG